MISELFGLLSAIDVTGKGNNRKLGLNVNLNRNRIRSISAFSSNSIFYFPCIVTDQAMPEEVAMVSRMIEKSYASFVVACIALMPFHRIRSDDQASIEEYLSQFHQNIGMTGGSGAAANKVFRMIDALPMKESATEAEERVADWLLECWHKSLEENSDFIKIVGSEVSLNDMFNESALDEKTQILREKYYEVQNELNTWGFLGEATEDLFDIEDNLDSDDDTDDDDSEFGEDLMNETSFDDVCAQAKKNIDNPVGTLALGQSYTMTQVSIVINAATTAAELARAKEFAYGIVDHNYSGMDAALYKKSVDLSIDFQRKKIAKQSSKKINEGVIRIPAQATAQAIDSIKFALESVSENKITSCQSLTKLRSLETKLKTLKTKYTKYFNRYKKKWKENQKTGGKSKLAIMFNKIQIADPKAFMKQYGEYIKIINRRLKLVEKRRTELRKRKGIKTEAAIPDMLTSLEFDTLDYCDRVISESLAAPDSEVFIYLDEAKNGKYNASAASQKIIRSYRAENKELTDQNEDLTDQLDQAASTAYEINLKYTAATKRADQAEKRADQKEQERRGLEQQLVAAKKDSAQLVSGIRAEMSAANTQYQATLNRYKAKIDELKVDPNGPGPDEPDSSDNDSRLNVDYDRRKPAGGINVARARAKQDGKFTTYSREVFTDMDMKKANDAIPIFTKANIGFVIDETEEVVGRDVLIGIKAYVHRAPSAELINDIYNCVINKRKFLKFVKFITGEERSLADLLFGFRELRSDALDARTGAGEWRSAFKRRRRWAKMSIPYLTKEYTPNGTIILTMNEVDFIREQYGIDIMQSDHVRMIMDADYLLGFVILDQANEMVYVTYDGHGYGFQQYTYAMLEREQAQTDRMMRELYRAMAR